MWMETCDINVQWASIDTVKLFAFPPPCPQTFYGGPCLIARLERIVSYKQYMAHLLLQCKGPIAIALHRQEVVGHVGMMEQHKTTTMQKTANRTTTGMLQDVLRNVALCSNRRA